MELSQSQIIPLPRQQVWDALNDPAILKACIAGCESLERISETEYALAITAAIGPVKAKFKGKLQLADLDPPRRYTLSFDGQGGVAGFGKGSAAVSLHEEAAGTRLDYSVKAQVGGRIAQVGSRLIDAAAKKMAEDFFAAFKRQLAPGEVPAAPPAKGLPRLVWWIMLGAALALAAYFLMR
ncbi:MAG: carbon monoxide dehydrogenase subunit G [Burkholderiales bacterium]|nr:MAG: carbon monoxide dehydrogenase subunit G [Burkholderiales bacterium]